MKNNLLLKFSFIALLLCSSTVFSFAQKGISKEDKKAIIEIFKDVKDTQYKLVFGKDGKERYGRKKIKMGDLRKILKESSPESKGVKWTFMAGDRSANEVIYIYTEGMSKMASVLGKEKLKALQAIADKYEDVMPGGK